MKTNKKYKSMKELHKELEKQKEDIYNLMFNEVSSN